MRYTVVWLESVQDELTNIYIAAADKKAVTLASDRIDLELRNDPDKKVVPYGEQWVYQSDPLLILVRISPDDRLVEVTHVEVPT
jgi:hypothetical protein